MISVFFDCNVYNVFAGPSDSDKSWVDELQGRVRKELAGKRLIVLGGPDVLREVMNAAPARPDKCLKMIQLFCELVDGHLLKERPWRLHEELRRRGPIPPGRLYMGAEVMEGLRRCTHNMESVQDFISSLEDEDTSAESEARYEAFKEVIKKAPCVNVKKATGALFERIPELVQEAIERDCSAQGVEPRGIKATSVPFLYHLYGFGFTRFLERGAYDKTYKKGDQRDMNHFTDGAACGYLVAEDGLFRETCSRVPQPHVEVISMRDLASKLR